jgi:hypothetical protein
VDEGCNLALHCGGIAILEPLQQMPLDHLLGDAVARFLDARSQKLREIAQIGGLILLIADGRRGATNFEIAVDQILGRRIYNRSHAPQWRLKEASADDEISDIDLRR